MAHLVHNIPFLDRHFPPVHNHDYSKCECSASKVRQTRMPSPNKVRLFGSQLLVSYFQTQANTSDATVGSNSGYEYLKKEEKKSFTILIVLQFKHCDKMVF